MNWLWQKCRSTWNFILSLRIEPFIFLFIMSSNANEVTRTQLVQDKFCLNNYNQSRQFCIDLSKNKDNNDGPDDIVNKILGDVSQLYIYITILSTLPGIVFVLFIGPWIDSYAKGRRVILTLGTVGYTAWYGLMWLNAYQFQWDPYYFLLAYFPTDLVGGFSCIWMTAYSYMTNNTCKKNRFIKFATFELATFIGRPLGVYLGGMLLGNGNYQGTGNLHNYQTVFIFSIVCGIVQLIWTLLFIKEGHVTKANKEDNNIEMKDSNDNVVQDKKETQFRISKMFDLKNIRELYRTAIKVRPNRGRTQIWLLYLSMCCLMLTDLKSLSILFPYAERVYGWDARQFSDIKSIFSIFQIIALPLASLILSTVLKLNDSKLGIFGMICYFMSDVCIASILHPIGLYLLFAVSGPSIMASLAIRSLLSKIASESESGRIFAVLGALEQIFPTLEALVLNLIFKYTLHDYPSMTFLFATAINFVPLYVFFWIDLIQ